MERDPVCGMSVDPEKARAKVEHGGKSYYFCSAQCGERFALEPGKFLAAPGTAGMEPPPQKLVAIAAAPAKGIRYTCPMDPEIVQIGPGTCPICGMALEPMDIVAEEQADPEYDSMRKRLWVGTALSVPLLVLSMFGDALGLASAARREKWGGNSAGFTGGVVVRVAIFPAFLALVGESQSEYVHADWARYWRGVFL